MTSTTVTRPNPYRRGLTPFRLSDLVYRMDSVGADAAVAHYWEGAEHQPIQFMTDSPMVQMSRIHLIDATRTRVCEIPSIFD